MKPLKILIIDDDTARVKGIKNTLEKTVANSITIYPKHFESNNNTVESSNVIIDKIRKGEFNTVIEHYKDVDIYIIDQCLKGNNDDLGITMLHKIKEANHNPNAKIYVISSNQLNAKFNLGQYENVEYVSKFNFGIYFNRHLVKTIIKNEKLTLKDPTKEKGIYNFISGYDAIKDFLKLSLDFIISAMFFITIFILAFMALSNIVISIHSSKEYPETEILKNSEHIFLYILPVFILLGFYVYYKNNISITLRDGNLYKDPELRPDDSSTKTMNFTKLMFISSIVSFIIVKIIDLSVTDTVETYTKKGEKVIFHLKQIPLDKIICLGSILIILMVYFLILNQKHE